MNKKILGLILALVLILSTFVGCGSEETKTEESKPKTLSGKVDIVTLPGNAYDSFNMSKDYRVKKVSSNDEMISLIRSGSYDVAVLDTVDAANLYNKTNKGFLEISPIAMDDIKVIQNGYVKQTVNRNVYNEQKQIYELKTEELETRKYYLRSKKIVAFGHKGDTLDTVVTEILSKEYVTLGEQQIEWTTDKKVFNDKMQDFGTVGIAYSDVADYALSKNDKVKTIYNFGKEWKELYKTEIPRYTLIVNKDFYETKKDDLDIFLEAYGKSIEKAKEGKDNSRLVLFTVGNRGIGILKDFNKVIFENSPEAIGEKALGNSAYLSK